jgi:hypothetical protein
VESVNTTGSRRHKERVVCKNAVFRNSVDCWKSTSSTRNEQATNDGGDNNTSDGTTGETCNEGNERETVLGFLLAFVGFVVTSNEITRSIGPLETTFGAVVNSDLARVVSDVLITDQRSTESAFGNVWREVGRIRAVQWDIWTGSIDEVARTNVTGTILLTDGLLSNFEATTISDGATSFTTSIWCGTTVKRGGHTDGLVGTVELTGNRVTDISSRTEWSNYALVVKTCGNVTRISWDATSDNGRTTSSIGRTRERIATTDTSLTFWNDFTTFGTTYSKETRVAWCTREFLFTLISGGVTRTNVTRITWAFPWNNTTTSREVWVGNNIGTWWMLVSAAVLVFNGTLGSRGGCGVTTKGTGTCVVEGINDYLTVNWGNLTTGWVFRTSSRSTNIWGAVNWADGWCRSWCRSWSLSWSWGRSWRETTRERWVFAAKVDVTSWAFTSGFDTRTAGGARIFVETLGVGLSCWAIASGDVAFSDITEVVRVRTTIFGSVNTTIGRHTLNIIARTGFTCDRGSRPTGWINTFTVLTFVCTNDRVGIRGSSSVDTVWETILKHTRSGSTGSAGASCSSRVNNPVVVNAGESVTSSNSWCCFRNINALINTNGGLCAGWGNTTSSGSSATTSPSTLFGIRVTTVDFASGGVSSGITGISIGNGTAGRTTGRGDDVRLTTDWGSDTVVDSNTWVCSTGGIAETTAISTGVGLLGKTTDTLGNFSGAGCSS